MNKDLIAIFEYLEREKGIKREIVAEAIRESLEQAAKKSVHGGENVTVQINPRSGEIEIFCDKLVVEKVTNPVLQITYKDAVQYVPDAVMGQVINVPTTPKDFGRVAAQKARQIIFQKLRGAERSVIQDEYRHRVNTIVSGTVKRVARGGCLIVDLGKVEGLLPRKNYLPQENFNVGSKVLALLSEVRDTDLGGAEVVLSRSCTEFVLQLLSQEVSEVSDGTVFVEKIAREPGYRTKMIVRSQDPKVDPVGACIGVRGARVKNIIRELGGEKLDVIPYAQNIEEQLALALQPVVVRKQELSEDGESVFLVVEDDDFPTTIGKKGMNVRLLGRLLQVQLTVQKMSDYVKLRAIERASLATSEDASLDEPLTSLEGIPSMIIEELISGGFATPRALLMASPEDIAKIPGISAEIVEKVLEQIRKNKSNIKEG
jgi:transcription termination/antitermination protein NusA